mmetsp:Transcript_24189/g.67260  ORF Transcript_24189/g.67260 Transcript_24189/m.67260 type:complete len:281 (-) Transcript_24189:592-1434(-)
MIRTPLPPGTASSAARMDLTSAAVCTNDAATKSTALRHPNSCRSFMSLSVSTGRSTLTPGRLAFLHCPSFLLLSTRPRSSVPLTTSTTSMDREPSASRILLPGPTVWQSLAYDRPMWVLPVARSLKPSQVVYSSPTATMVISWPASRKMSLPSRSMAVRISGPLVSSSTAAWLPLALATERRRSRTRWWSSWEPWLKLRRAMLSPASRSSAMPSSLQQRGPIVQTSFVFRYGTAFLSSSVSVLMRSVRAVVVGFWPTTVATTAAGLIFSSPGTCRRDAMG